ncbi:hypothetical protein HPSA20_1460 [Helicobacter pylori SouthAfrica20]|uniref:Uncharacterized protein n=1 Tax=Helicobacter pylori SouthAfrica20 TaxID=1352356 RepID=T1UBH6_HELPX|nr:hypothetical protein HPSA20_1460 [Helicobacter pylori SouthAfrica20]
MVHINRNLRMLNEQAFKVLQSQNLLDWQAEKELNNALGSITNYNWHCGETYRKDLHS